MVNPDNILDLFAKSVDVAGYAGPIPESLLSRQDLEAEIVKLTNRNTPLRDVTPRERGEGRAHLWNVRTALGGLPSNNNQLGIFYKDGALPVESDPQYVEKAAAYAYLGVDFFAPHAREGMFKLRKFGESPQARTIPSQARQRWEGVETRDEALERGDSIVRTAWQHAESDRNALTSPRGVTTLNRRCHWTDAKKDTQLVGIVKSRYIGETPGNPWTIPSQPAVCGECVTTTRETLIKN